MSASWRHPNSRETEFQQGLSRHLSAGIPFREQYGPQDALISAVTASVSRTRSCGCTEISKPRLPALHSTRSQPSAEASTTVGNRFRCPSGEIPPSTYPVERSAAARSAIVTLATPSAAAAAFNDIWLGTGNTAT